MALLRAIDVARYFLAMQDASETLEGITNLKIQKLCYYAQGISLVIMEKPLFFDDIESWTHGPVVPTLYRRYQYCGSSPIPPSEDLDLTLYDRETKNLLDKVYQQYGQDSAWGLRNKTHEESPWRNTPHGSQITFKDLRAYFESLPTLFQDFADMDSDTLRQLPKDPQVTKDLKRGVEAFKSGQLLAWDQIREELGIS